MARDDRWLRADRPSLTRLPSAYRHRKIPADPSSPLRIKISRIRFAQVGRTSYFSRCPHGILSLEVAKVCRNREYLVVRQPPASHRDGYRSALERLLHTFLEDVHLVLNACHLVLKVCHVHYIVDCLLAQIGSCEVPLLVSGHKLYVTRLRRSTRG